MAAKLQKEKDEFTSANKVALLNVEKLNAEMETLSLNATLKVFIVELEFQLADSEAELKDAHTVSQKRKKHAEQCKSEVADLHMEVDGLKRQLDSVILQTENIRDVLGSNK
ncbi:hypothetical protein DPEC_G00205700 [Dallia pectoralis]|uniref:Uncharacterized protein n=1 Tax=Dallia pectoralis TaxID=75939 RepID=A0ACC2G446_DALPE|nr:hypothetical protein DPEC_G00205700 [Dallia pectoralis]